MSAEINICDSIMGSGKTEAAITYMREHPNNKFLFISPFLSEDKRVKENCPELNFIEPVGTYKYNHIKKLLSEGSNVASTHKMFTMFNDEVIYAIEKWQYTLIIDENMELINGVEVCEQDLRLLTNGGILAEDDTSYTLKHPYNGSLIDGLLGRGRVTTLYKSIKPENGKRVLCYWVLNPNIIKSFKKVFILTYLSEGQGFHHLFKMNSIPFKYIGTQKCQDGVYRFSERPVLPGYVKNIRGLITIIDHERLNKRFSQSEFDLSRSWYQKNTDERKAVGNALTNFYRNICNAPTDKQMWSVYSECKEEVGGKRYEKSFTQFNERATNRYAKRNCLAYLVNVFANMEQKTFLENQGLTFDEDLYALSTMVQWIWRSAIRNGKPITLYLPSARMRRLLNDWLNSLER